MEKSKPSFIKGEQKLKEATYVVNQNDLSKVKDKFEKDDVVKVVEEDMGKVIGEKTIKNEKYVMYDNWVKKENWKTKEDKTYIPLAKYNNDNDKPNKVYLGEDGNIYNEEYFNEPVLERYTIKKSILKEFINKK